MSHDAGDSQKAAELQEDYENCLSVINQDLTEMNNEWHILKYIKMGACTCGDCAVGLYFVFFSDPCPSIQSFWSPVREEVIFHHAKSVIFWKYRCASCNIQSVIWSFMREAIHKNIQIGVLQCGVHWIAHFQCVHIRKTCIIATYYRVQSE